MARGTMSTGFAHTSSPSSAAAPLFGHCATYLLSASVLLLCATTGARAQVLSPPSSSSSADADFQPDDWYTNWLLYGDHDSAPSYSMPSQLSDLHHTRGLVTIDPQSLSRLVKRAGATRIRLLKRSDDDDVDDVDDDATAAVRPAAGKRGGNMVRLLRSYTSGSGSISGSGYDKRGMVRLMRRGNAGGRRVQRGNMVRLM